MTKVYNEKQLAEAIREAMNEQNLCFIEVLFEDSIFIEKILSESLPILFSGDFQEMNENLKNDGEAFCTICVEKIVNKDFVVSYEICKGKHMFHLKCIEYLSGDILCPLDRNPLAGPRNTWIFRSNDDNLDDDDSDLLHIPMFDSAQGSANIETECNQCGRPYQVQDEKITLLCSHTFCNQCFELTMSTCLVCGETSQPYNCSTGDYEVVNGLTTITHNLEDANSESASPGSGQEMLARRLDLGMIIELEDLLGTGQEGDQIEEIEEPVRYNEEAEEPAGNEEMENAEADSSLETTLETFWDIHV